MRVQQTLKTRLDRAIAERGVTLAQVGAHAVTYEMRRGSIALTLGEAGNVVCRDLDEAIARIAKFAEELGADPDRPGAIVRFVDGLRDLVEAEESGALDLDPAAVDALASSCGMHLLGHVVEEGEDEQIEDDGDELGFFEDPNRVVWCVAVDDDGKIAFEPKTAFEPPRPGPE